MLNTNSDTLRRIVQADLKLQPRSSACWTAKLLSAFQKLRGCELHVRAVQTGHAITMQEFTADLKHMISGQFVVVCVGVHQLSVSPNTSHPMLQICSKL